LYIHAGLAIIVCPTDGARRRTDVCALAAPDDRDAKPVQCVPHAPPPVSAAAVAMGYAGYVPAKIAQFEFTPLEQARAARSSRGSFAGSTCGALQPRPAAPRARASSSRPVAPRSGTWPMRVRVQRRADASRGAAGAQGSASRRCRHAGDAEEGAQPPAAPSAACTPPRGRALRRCRRCAPPRGCRTPWALNALGTPRKRRRQRRRRPAAAACAADAARACRAVCGAPRAPCTPRPL